MSGLKKKKVFLAKHHMMLVVVMLIKILLCILTPVCLKKHRLQPFHFVSQNKLGSPKGDKEI